MKLVRALNLPRLIAIVTIAGVFAIAFRAPLDTDTYWHLRAGQWQVEHRALLTSDAFSFTRMGESWVNVHWLSQVLLYVAYRALGDAGLALFTALFAAAGMAAIYRITEGDPLVRAGAVLLAALAAAVFWSARSQMVSFFFSALVVSLLWNYQKRGIDRLWLIPPVMIVWANSHGGFAIGFMLIGLSLLGELAQVLMSLHLSTSDAAIPTSAGFRPVLQLALIGFVSAFAVLLNPFGAATLLLPFRTVGMSVLRDSIQEWAAPNFHLSQMWPFAVMLIGTFLCAGISSRRLEVRDAVLLGGMAAGSLLAGRNIPTFALVAAPILSVHADTVLGDSHISLNSRRIPARGLFLAVNWLLLLLVAAGIAIKMIYEVNPTRLESARRAQFPVGAVDFLEASKPPRELFNSYNWGGYLIWAARQYPVFVDGRTDLYDDSFMADYLSIYDAQPGWSDKLDRAGVNTVLVESSSPLAQVLAISPGWTRDYSDSLAVVYTRTAAVGR